VFWRCVLLSGPAGSGKTTVCRLGHRTMLATWGHPTAAIDADQLYANVDARWELPYDDERNAMVLTQAAQLAGSLFEHGWPTVIICGNSLFEPAGTAPVLTTLCPIARVHHVTLTPDPATLLRRCATAPGRDPSRLAADADLHARKGTPRHGPPRQHEPRSRADAHRDRSPDRLRCRPLALPHLTIARGAPAFPHPAGLNLIFVINLS